MRNSTTFGILALLCVGVAIEAHSHPAVDQSQLPTTYVPSGGTIYKEHCAACHGPDAKGDGPYAPLLKVPPANLTTLAKRHDGKFPEEYVSDILRFGARPSILHGSADMPTWGPIFQYIDKSNQAAVQQRIKNLCEYLALLQEK
jgi:mono/diheme cytochrome c family protein